MQHKSVWLAGNAQKYPMISGSCSADAVVVGGGITGLTTAYLLAREGLKVAVMEARTIGAGATGHTTAHITSQHNLIYYKLLNRFGEKAARLAAQANERAIDDIETIVTREKINCAFVRTDSFLYTNSDKEIKAIENEEKAARDFGIDAELVNDIPFLQPYIIALRYKNQAMFNPVQYINGLAEAIVRMDGKIFEKSRVLHINGDNVSGKTGIVKAKHIVIATHYPIINFPGMYFARIYQDRSYCVAAENAPALPAMWNATMSNGCSFRPYDNMLIISGGSHRTGTKGNTSHYEQLENFVSEQLPGTVIVYKWSAQDGFTLDDMPYIGRYSKRSDNLYVATGYAKWGMTYSNVAGHIICDLITGNKNPYAEVFDPDRPATLYAVGKAVAMNASVAYHYIGGLVKRPKCPHMKCGLNWNANEQSWDCPCHGSRFDKNGNVLETPSIHGDSEIK